MALLAFGGLHTDAIENLKTMVPKRLEKNAKLRAELAAGFEQSGGTSLPIDHVRLDQLFEMIARGLAFYHWQIILGQGHSAIASIFADDGIDFFARMFDGWNAAKGVAENLGKVLSAMSGNKRGTVRKRRSGASQCMAAFDLAEMLGFRTLLLP